MLTMEKCIKGNFEILAEKMNKERITSNSGLSNTGFLFFLVRGKYYD